MRKIILSCIYMLFVATAFSQASKAELLVNKVWKIKSDEMSGVGLHTSLPENAELQFFADGTWKLSEPGQEKASGTWRVENNRTLIIINKEEIKYLLLQLTENELQYRLKKNAATYTYTWLRKK